ncbi:MAG: shikimate kinase [Bacillota bacterium]|nr:shikimate kinase [Bacillota bacterium]
MRPDVKPTRRYALIGHPLGHSLSPVIHAEIDHLTGASNRYDLCEVPPEELAARLPRLLEQYDGLNVTIPHKERVIPLLTSLDPRAKALGAVNTINCQLGRGHNTDAGGVRPDLGDVEGARVLIIGAGGVARTLAALVLEMGCKELLITGRSPERVERFVADIARGLERRRVHSVTPDGLGELLLRREGAFDLIINATAAGMWPAVGELPLERGLLEALFDAGRPHVFDAVYNPPATRLLLLARSAGLRATGGLAMLWRQAVLARQIWEPDNEALGALITPSPETLGRLARELWRHFGQRIVLTGFVGSGKGVVVARLPQAFGLGGLGVSDLDDAFAAATGQHSPAWQREHGEARFRQMERQVLDELLATPGSQVIATGAGTLIQPGLAEHVHDRNALVVWLNAPLGLILERFRPAFERAGAGAAELREQTERLYRQRLALYREAADLMIDAGGTPDQVARRIAHALELA